MLARTINKFIARANTAALVIIPARLTPVGRGCMSLTFTAYLFSIPPQLATLLFTGKVSVLKPSEI